MGIEITSKINPVLSQELPEQDKIKVQETIAPEKTMETSPDISKVQIHRLIADLEHQIQQFNRRLKFEVNEELGRIVVKVIDRETDRIIKEIPSAEIQTLISRIRETLGILFDTAI